MTISKAQRESVRNRAGNCCEYCRVSQASRLVQFQVDHIIAVKHSGTDDEENLCLACYKCNNYKGSNIATIDRVTGDVTKLYNPRQQKWDEHFRIEAGAKIIGLSPEGRATITVLRINDEQRILQRQGDANLGDYPCITGE